MGNYENLKQSITEVIRTNGNQEITGAVLQSTLLTIISTVGANATFAGIATPTTNPGTPDGSVFYLASESGTYTNFNAIELQDGLSILMWNGAWSSQQIFGIDDVPTAGSDNLIKSGGVYAKIKALEDAGYIFAGIATPATNPGTPDGSVFYLASESGTYTNFNAIELQDGLSILMWNGAWSSQQIFSVDNVPTAGSDNLIKSGGVYLRTPTVGTSGSSSDLDIKDEQGYVLSRFSDGHIKTKNFDSKSVMNKLNGIEIGAQVNNIITKTIEIDDLAISDEQGYVLARFANGHIKTKNFDSAEVGKAHYSSFSIIGDSYSTFDGYTDPANNAQWYPNSSDSNDVKNVEQMWWYLFANEYSSALVQNNSYSGSTICYDGYGSGHDSGAAATSFCKRIEDVTKECELIFIFGGTNDSWAGSAIGDYKYSNWTEDDKSYFRPALAYLIDYIRHHHIGTKIIFIKNTDLSSDISDSIDAICEHYSVKVISLSSISKIAGHPSIEGMIQIKNQIISNL